MQQILFERQYENLATDEERIKLFSNFPYKEVPYSRRNWGHPWHSFCSYQSKLKPAIAYFLIKIFTRVGDRILDPFAGVGTIPFEACLQNRIGIGVDINPVAFNCMVNKLTPPGAKDVRKVFNDLKNHLAEYELTDSDYSQVLLKNINGKLEDYYDPITFEEILKARSFFLSRITFTSADSFVLASLLHILHGNRPYALSRRSHGLTPFSPSGEFIYKPLLEHLQNKVNRLLAAVPSDLATKGEAYFTSVFNYQPSNQADVIITSPPFVKSTRFYLNNWIRLWFCGWQDKDFSSSERNDFVEELQARDISIYKNIFNKFYEVLKPGGICILHLGAGKGHDMGVEVEPYAVKAGFDKLNLLYEDVSRQESHGITDKGRTMQHQFLFLRRHV